MKVGDLDVKFHAVFDEFVCHMITASEVKGIHFVSSVAKCVKNTHTCIHIRDLGGVCVCVCVCKFCYYVTNVCFLVCVNFFEHIQTASFHQPKRHQVMPISLFLC